jgi:HSP20 family molecular chaperone IbpA
MGITDKINALLPRPRQENAPAPAGHASPLALRDDFDQWLQRFVDQPWAFHPLGGLGGGARTPNVELRDTGDSVQVRAELPGLAKDDVDLTIAPEGLIIRAEKREEKREKDAFASTYTSFVETVPLPPGIDVERAEARVEDGVLTVRFPKAASAPGSRRIPIQT